MKRTLFLSSCAVVAFFDRLCGREIAINAVAEAPAPAAIEVGIPSGLSQTAIAARTAALVNIGTPRFLAEKFAIDAERQQAWHDSDPKKREGAQASPKTEAEKIAAGILEAQRVDPTQKAKTLTSKQLLDRAAAVKKVEDATKALAGAAKDTDRATAEEALRIAQQALAEVEAQA